MTRPLSELTGPVRALFSDVDGTMTTGERIEASTYEALERLGEAGVPVIMVTGRPAGFGQAFMQMTPDEFKQLFRAASLRFDPEPVRPRRRTAPVA